MTDQQTHTQDQARRVDRKSVGSNARFGILALLFFVTALNYLDRSILSIALPSISEEYSLSPTQEGLLLSAFSWTYALSQIPGGWLVDRIGPRLAYTGAILAWSTATVATGVVRSFNVLLGTRMLLGAAEAPSFPANNALVTRWFPGKERARATSVYISGQYIGLAVALPVLTWMIATYGWRSIFVIIGAAGILYAFIWMRFARDLPPEVDTDGEEQAPPIATVKHRIEGRDVRYLLTQRRLWGLYISQYCSNGVMWFFLTWFPTYLVNEKGIDFIKVGFLAVLPYLAALCGALLSGYWSDRMLAAGVSRTWARKIPIMTGFVLGSSIMLANYTTTPAFVIAIMSFAFFSQGLCSIGWTLASEIAPLNMLGLTGGVFNFFTNMGGATVPLIIGLILGATGTFETALVFIAGLAVLGLLSYVFLIDRVDRLDPVAARS